MISYTFLPDDLHCSNFCTRLWYVSKVKLRLLKESFMNELQGANECWKSLSVLFTLVNAFNMHSPKHLNYLNKICCELYCVCCVLSRITAFGLVSYSYFDTSYLASLPTIPGFTFSSSSSLLNWALNFSRKSRTQEFIRT